MAPVATGRASTGLVTTPSADEFREQQSQNWEVAASGWRRRHAMMARCSAPVTERMLELAGIDVGDHVLDIASGSGEPAISAARRVGPTGKVIGTDLVEAMLVHARAHAAEAGLKNLEFRCVSAEHLEFQPDSFDAVTLRWGLMFMPEPERALQRIRRILRPGGALTLTCWTAPAFNPFITVAVETLEEFCEMPAPQPGAPSMFSFAEEERLNQVLTDAGFSAIEIQSFEFTVIEAPSPSAYWDVVQDLAAPLARLYADLSTDRRRAFIRALDTRVYSICTGPTVELSGRTWIAAARKP